MSTTVDKAMDADAVTIPLNQGGTLTAAAGLNHAPLPLEPYRSESYFERERSRIFERAWLLVGRVEELPEPGSYVLKSVPPTAVSALITHSQAGRIQAFHNSCSHRGSAIVAREAGQQSRFVCPYHRWTYGDDGRLLGVTDEADFVGLEKSRCGLKPIATTVWQGWIFINLAPQPEVDLATFLGPMKDYLEGIAYRATRQPLVFSAELDANWKVVSDAFVESYHVPAIHPDSLAGPFAASSNPFGRFLSARLLGNHQAVSYFGNPDYQLPAHAKVQAMIARLAAESPPSDSAQREMADFFAHAAINPTRSKYWSMDTNAVFPNSHIDCGLFGMWTHQFWPLAAHRTRYEGRFYLGEARNMRERLLLEMAAAQLAEVVVEDLANVARTQRGINSGGQTHMQLKDSEIGIRHALREVMRWVEADTVKEALR
jgi:phenylpropionate dioxygenase-like ring-hydroxylating dioxygenase large terminal subunit